MGRAAAALALVLLVSLRCAAGEPVPLGPCGPVARPYEVIELPVPRLGRLGGTPIAHVGVVAFRDGRPAAIPFQVDEKRGRKVALGNGPDPTSDDQPGKLDADDLVVFMACDGGEPRGDVVLEEALRDAGVTAWREIRVEDPLTHHAGFAYLVVADHPPLTDRRYVAYEPAGDLVRAARYRVGLAQALPIYFALAGPHGPGPNLLDGLRLRAEATLRADLAHWTLNERQGRHELIAWKEGPVRVIRRSRHQVAIGLGIHLTAGLAHTYFYPNHVVGPGSLKLPFSPGVLFNEISAFGGVDGRDLAGWRYYAPGVPRDGFLVDGKMDASEQAFAGSGDWFALAHDGDGILFVTRMSENLARGIRLSLVYRDDATRPNPPETAPGTMPLAGYEGRGVEKLPGGRYEFSLRVLVLPGFRPGDEKPLLAAIDHPLTAEVTAGFPATAPAAGEGASPARR